MTQQITPNDIVDLLNSLLVLDPQAIRSLINQRVDCNHSIADHSTVQVLVDKKDNVETCQVGLLGILNGLLNSGRIYAEVIVMEDEQSEEILSFKYIAD